jgi:hypothetical protein
MSRRRGPGGEASFGGERRLVECPADRSIFLPEPATTRIRPPRRRSIALVSLRRELDDDALIAAIPPASLGECRSLATEEYLTCLFDGVPESDAMILSPMRSVRWHR